jgi:CheY-like chemotaxis protein
MDMRKTVLLVGHCGADSAYLKLTVKKVLGDVDIRSAEDSQELSKALETGTPELILFNRELGYGFDPNVGVEMIRILHQTYPDLKMMLVSNYADAQQAAEAAGALPGFGKRELGSPRVFQILREALGTAATK